MSLLEQASLVMIPSGYKEDVVYCPKPTDGSGDLTFTRASDGTRVNSSGLVENVPWNLFQYSNDFSNVAWTKYNATLTSGQSDPFGGTNAWKFEAIISAQADFRQTVSGANSYSFYAKAGTSPEFRLWSGTSGTIFNLSTGTISSGSGIIESVGNGWYRCTILTSTSASVTLIPYFVGNAGDYIYVAFGQAQTTTTAKPYFPTTDRQNVPRLTYEGGCPSLLLEPQRTNDVFPSEDFSGYSGSGATISTNQAVSPDGTQNADLMYPATSGNFAGKYKNVAATTTGVVSCFVKQAGKRYAIVGTDNNATYTCIFDLQTATVVYEATNYTGSIEALSNGWYRISAVYTSSTAAAYPFIGVADNSSGSVVVDGTNGIYIWGFQYERNVSYPTSYIPTTSASVTRVADAAYKTGISSLIGQTQGTLFADIIRTTSTGNDSFWLNINDNSSNNWIFMGIDGLGSRFYLRASSTTIVDEYPSLSLGRHKLAIAYQSGSIVGYIDGTQVFTSSSTYTIGSLTGINLGYSGASLGTPVNTPAQVNEVVLFPTSLTNAELAALTTL